MNECQGSIFAASEPHKTCFRRLPTDVMPHLAWPVYARDSKTYAGPRTLYSGFSIVRVSMRTGARLCRLLSGSWLAQRIGFYRLYRAVETQDSNQR